VWHNAAYFSQPSELTIVRTEIVEQLNLKMQEVIRGTNSQEQSLDFSTQFPATAWFCPFIATNRAAETKASWGGTTRR
jgi:hypothetical protein